MASVYDLISDARKKQLVAERLRGGATRSLGLKPVSYTSDVGGIPIFNKYAGIQNAAMQVDNIVNDYYADKAEDKYLDAKRGAIEGVLANQEGGMDIKTALALDELGIDSSLVKSMMPRGGKTKEQYLASMAGQLTSPPTIKAAYYSGAFGEVDSTEAIRVRDELLASADYYWNTKQVTNPTKAYYNRFEIAPTDESVAAKNARGGAATSSSGSGEEWHEFDPSALPTDQPFIATYDGETNKPTSIVVGEEAKNWKPAGNVTDALFEQKGLPKERVEKSLKMDEDIAAMESQLGSLDMLSGVVNNPKTDLYGDKNRLGTYLTTAGGEGFIGDAIRSIGKGLLSPDAVQAGEASLGVTLGKLKMMGGNDTEREFQWLSANMPSAFSNPESAKRYVAVMNRMAKKAVIAARMRKRDFLQRKEGTNLFVSDLRDPMQSYSEEANAYLDAEDAKAGRTKFAFGDESAVASSNMNKEEEDKLKAALQRARKRKGL